MVAGASVPELGRSSFRNLNLRLLTYLAVELPKMGYFGDTERNHLAAVAVFRFAGLQRPAYLLTGLANHEALTGVLSTSNRKPPLRIGL